MDSFTHILQGYFTGTSASKVTLKDKGKIKTITNHNQAQLERLRSEIPPPAAAPWLPTLGIHIRSQVKTKQSQSYKF